MNDYYTVLANISEHCVLLPVCMLELKTGKNGSVWVLCNIKFGSSSVLMSAV